MRDGWRQTTLGEVAEWFSGATPKATDSSNYGGGIPWAVIADVRNRPIESTATTLTERGAALAGRRAPVGSVLVTMYGTIGRSALVQREMATNQAIAWGVPGPSVTSEFLFLLVQSLADDLDSLGRGATQRNINRRILKEMSVTVPPLVEQRRIVDLIAALDDTIQEHRNIEQSSGDLLDRMRDAVPPGEQRRVGDVMREIVNGVTTSAADQASGSGKQKFVKASAIQPGEFVASETKVAGDQEFDMRYYINVGDVLMTRINTPERVGQIARVVDPVDGLLRPDLVWRLELDRELVDPDYFVHALSGPSGRSAVSAEASGTSRSMQQISKTRFANVPLSIPRLDVQGAFADRCNAVLAVKRQAIETISRLAALRTNLLTAVLSGEHEIPASYDDLIETRLEAA